MTRLRGRLQIPLLLLALSAPAAAQDVTVTPGATGGFVVEDNSAFGRNPGASPGLRV